MASYDVAFDQNAGLQVGHSSGNIYYTSSPLASKVDSAFDIPDLLSPYFTGRKNELVRLKEIYQTSSTDGPARCIVYGMPGLGKTQLALRFAYLGKKDYPFIFWISGASIEKLNTGFLGILDHLDGTGTQDENARNQAVKRWFEKQDKKWLLVVDNVNEQTTSHLKDILPITNAKGNVLITTRYQNVAESLKFAHGENHNTIELQDLGEDDSVELFFATRHKSSADDIDSSDHGDVKIITKKVGYLPLAIDQAASFSNTPGQTIQKVLSIYSNPEANEAFQWDSETTKHENISVQACFGPILDRLNQSSPEACILLRILAFLDPEGIPLELVKNGIIDFKPRECDVPTPSATWPSRMRRFKERLLKKNVKVKTQTITQSVSDKNIEDEEDMQHLRTIFESPIKLQKLIQVLRRFSIIKLKDNDNSTIWIHDLVHQLIRQNLMKKDQRDRWFKITVDITSASFGRIGYFEHPAYWKETAKFVTHVQKLREYLAAQEKDNEVLIDLEVDITTYLTEFGSYEEASKILERIVANGRASLDKESNVMLTSIHNLALAYSRMGRPKEAEQLYLKELGVRKKISSAEDPSVLFSMNNLAVTYQEQGRMKEAEELQEELLVVQKRVLGIDHPDTLRNMSNIAYTYYCSGRLNEAEKLTEETLAMQKKVLDDKHPDTIRTLYNLAHILKAKGDIQEAFKLMEMTVERQSRVYGSDHPYTKFSIKYLDGLRKISDSDSMKNNVNVDDTNTLPEPEKS